MMEKILCAAVWYKDLECNPDIPKKMFLPKNIKKGVVFSGYRHSQCILMKCALTGLMDAESGENEQGFLTSKNRFVSREEALKIAIEANQVIDLSQVRVNRLFSEDLY
jgi:hypothetical protein